jgi:hypothetical protein
MDAETYREAIEYEKLTQAIYQAILAKEGQNIAVQHNVPLAGRSGVEHQVDVYWRFRQAAVEHTVLVECKNYASALTLEKVRNFFGVLHDVGNCRGIMVTKTDYQSGVEQFARHYGIELKIMREPTDADWEGRVKDIHLRISARSAASSDEHPVSVQIGLKAVDNAQQARLQQLQSAGRLNIPNSPDLVFYSRDGRQKTDQMRYWLPRQLNVLDKADGGPYVQMIPLDDFFIYINEGQLGQEFVQVEQLTATFFVETMDTRTIALHGDQIVEAMLKDHFSGAVEHVKHRE